MKIHNLKRNGSNKGKVRPARRKGGSQCSRPGDAIDWGSLAEKEQEEDISLCGLTSSMFNSNIFF